MKARTPPSLRQKSNIYSLLGTACLLGIGIACDAKSPVDPHGLLVADADASRSVTVSGVTATVLSWSEIDLSWPRSPSASGYQVFRSVAGGYTLIATTAAPVASYANTGLAGSTQYCYQVRSFKTAGKNTTYSAYMGPVCATTPSEPIPPAAPTNATAKLVSRSAVTVTWTDISDNESGFRVERSAATTGPWTVAATTGANVTSTTDPGLATEQQVCYRVVAFNSYGASGPSNTICTAVPAPPTNLTATAVLQEIDLAWSDNSSVEDGYVVLRDMGSFGLEVMAYLPANATSYRDVGVGGGVTYTYVVRAMKDGVFSEDSNAASAECADAACPAACSGDFNCGLGSICSNNVCVPHCFDGVTDGDETDVDCGGDACSVCEGGQHCNVNGDCAVGECFYGICQ